MKDERETKEKLLQSARAEFLAKGYQGASLRSICKASGVTTGALYFFFKDKDDLFTSLVAPQLNTLKAMLTEHMRQELLVLDSGEDAAENEFRDDAYASQQVLHLLYQNYDLFLLLLTGSYAVAGICAAIAGIIVAGDIRGADANNAGLWLELDAILAVVIGGTSLLGGRFSIPMSVLGALIIQAMNTGILISGFPPEFNLMVKAGIIILILVLQSPFATRQLARRRPATGRGRAERTLL